MGHPSKHTFPEAARCQPSRSPTRLDFPAPDVPTMATWLPDSILRLLSSRIVQPAARTSTFWNLQSHPVLELSAAVAGLGLSDSYYFGVLRGSRNVCVILRFAGYCHAARAVSCRISGKFNAEYTNNKTPPTSASRDRCPISRAAAKPKPIK